MRILALGGSGDMGRMAVAILLASPKATSITIADKNFAFTESFVELVGSDKLTAVEIDVSDHEKLVDLMSKHDLVINTVGPFLKFGKPIVEAVIEAKKDYVDICDDWKPTLEILELHEKAKAAGITAVIGIGASPGLTNLMAVLACSELDEVEDVVTAWGFGSEKLYKTPPQFFVKKKNIIKRYNARPDVVKEPRAPRANAAIVHLLHESIGQIPTFREGKLTEVEALTDAPPIEFPGIKKSYSCHIGHPEPVTLCRTLKANSISCQMFLTEFLTNQIRKYVKKISAGDLTIAAAAIEIEKRLNSITILIRLFFILLKRLFKLPPTLCVFATGLKNKERRKIAIGIKHSPYGEIDYGMDGITAVPMAVTALMILEGQIKERGILTPEDAIDPEIFFKIYAQYCGKNLTADDLLIKKVVELY